MPDLDADVVREIDVVHHSDNGNHADDEQSCEVCRQQQPRQSLADFQFIIRAVRPRSPRMADSPADICTPNRARRSDLRPRGVRIIFLNESNTP